MGTQKEQQGSTTVCVTSGASITAGHLVIANGASNLINSTNLDYTATARLVAACGSAPTQGTTVVLYHVPKSDGTNVDGVDTSTPFINPNFQVGVFVWPAAASATTQYMSITGIPLPSIDVVPYLMNNLGQTISSGWTLTYYGDKSQY
jgi:hypothetical protein